MVLLSVKFPARARYVTLPPPEQVKSDALFLQPFDVLLTSQLFETGVRAKKTSICTKPLSLIQGVGTSFR